MEWTWKDMTSRESKLAASNSVQGDYQKHMSGFFNREERNGMEKMEAQKRK